MMSPEHFLGMTQGFISYTISEFYLLKSLINFLIDVFFHLTDLTEVSDQSLYKTRFLEVKLTRTKKLKGETLLNHLLGE